MRLFAPCYVTTIGSYFVAIDKTQPVAVAFTPAGVITDVNSWANNISPPRNPTWPSRQFAAVDNRVLIQDLPAEATISVELTPDGALRHTRADGEALPPDKTTQRRLWSATAPSRNQADLGWSLTSTLQGVRWSADISLDRGGSVSQLHLPAPASILAHSTLGATHAAVCVQRADKRPWPFQPPIEIHTVAAEPAGLVSTVLPDLDVSERCWPARPSTRDDPLQMQKELAQYLSYSVGQYTAASRYGAHDVELSVRDNPTGPGPEINLCFTLDEAPGTHFCRRDVPFDELGNLGTGLRDMNVSLVEDLHGGLVRSVLSQRSSTLGTTVHL